MNNGIVGQARWIPAEQSIAPACLKAILIAVAVLAVVKQVQDIKEGQKEIVGILERDKKSQLLADCDLLVAHITDILEKRARVRNATKLSTFVIPSQCARHYDCHRQS